MKILFIRISYVLMIIALIVILMAIFSYRSDISNEELEKKYFTPESKYIEIADARLHIRKRGTGPALFLVHGSFASLHTWQDWEDELSKSFTTISMDLPGHGLTGPNQSENYTTDYYADLIVALADTLHIDSFYVAGNSLGGNVAWKMALTNPERIRKLILIDASGFWQPVSETEASKPSKRPWIFNLLSNPIVSKIFTKITPRFLFKLNMKQVYGNPDLVTEQHIDRYYNLMLREGNREATLKRLKQPGEDLQDSISKISMPVLILWGKKDTWIPVENAYLFQHAIKNSQLVIFDDAGHVPMEEIPGESLQPALDFLRSNF